MRPMAGARSTAGEYPTVALWPTQVDARCKTGIAPRRTIGHAVSNPRIRACSPTFSDLVPTLGRPNNENRFGVPNRMNKPLKKDIRASSAPRSYPQVVWRIEAPTELGLADADTIMIRQVALND